MAKTEHAEPGQNLTPLKNEDKFSYQIWYLHVKIRTFNFCQNFAQEGIPPSGRKTLTHARTNQQGLHWISFTGTEPLFPNPKSGKNKGLNGVDFFLWVLWCVTNKKLLCTSWCEYCKLIKYFISLVWHFQGLFCWILMLRYVCN